MTDKSRQLTTHHRKALRRLWFQTLVIRFQAGDDRALGEIVAEMHPPLQQFLIHSFRLPKDQTEDLLQDVWLEVCRTLGRLREPAALRTWLYRIARSHALSFVRTQTRGLISLDMDTASQIPALPDVRSGPAGLLELIAPLTFPLRQVLVLRFYAGFSYDEIARTLDCPVGTVRSRIHHAKNQLRTLLSKENQS